MKVYQLKFRNMWNGDGMYNITAVGTSLAKALTAAELQIKTQYGKAGAKHFFLQELSDLGKVVIGK